MYKSIKKYENIVGELNIILNDVERLCGVSINERDELIDGMLFTRIRDGYAGVINLITSNFHLEAGILARSTVEAFLVFAAHIADKDKAYENLVAQHKYNKRKVINKIVSNGKYDNHYEKAKSIDKSELEGARDVKAHEWAKLGNQEDHYDYSYTFLSEYTHVNIDSLAKRLNVDGDMIIIGFRQLQDDYDLDLILTTTIDILIKTIQMLKTKYISLDKLNIDSLEERFSLIANQSDS